MQIKEKEPSPLKHPINSNDKRQGQRQSQRVLVNAEKVNTKPAGCSDVSFFLGVVSLQFNPLPTPNSKVKRTYALCPSWNLFLICLGASFRIYIKHMIEILAF